MSRESGASLRDANRDINRDANPAGSHSGKLDAERRATLSRSQQFAERAFQQVQQRQTGSKNEREKQDYASFAKRFPSLIHSCGLAQAVAFAQAKAPQHFLDDLRATMNCDHHIVEEFANEVRSADLMNYLRLSRQALEAAGWLKRYAEALLED